MSRSAPVVAVIGKGIDCPEEVAALAREAGEIVAKLDAVLVTGGLGGVMRAAAEGARAEGGLAIGLVPAHRDEDAYEAPGVVALRTGLSPLYRNALTASVADVAVLLPGSHGTVQEGMAMAETGVDLIAYGDHTGFRSAVLLHDCHAIARDRFDLGVFLGAALDSLVVKA